MSGARARLATTQALADRPGVRLWLPALPSATLTLAVRQWTWRTHLRPPDHGQPLVYHATQDVVARWVLVPYARPQPSPRALPPVAPLFSGGVAAIPSCLALQGIVAALHHRPAAGLWTRTEGGLLSFAQGKRGGHVTTTVRPPQDVLPPALWSRQAGDAHLAHDDLDVDVLLVALACWMESHRRLADGTVWLTADAVLDARAVRPKMQRREQAAYRAGHRQGDRQRVAASMDRLDQLWVHLQDVEMVAPDAPRHHIQQTHQSKVLLIAECLRHGTVPVAWRIAPGSWLPPFLERPNHQVAFLAQTALRYDPYHQCWEKRLALYLTIHLRINARRPGLLVRRLGPLLDELNLPVDRRHPERTRARCEAALDRLTHDGVIGSWSYTTVTQRALGRLPARQWLSTWFSGAVSLAPPRVVPDGSATLPPPAAAVECRDRDAMLSQPRRHRVLFPGDGRP